MILPEGQKDTCTLEEAGNMRRVDCLGSVTVSTSWDFGGRAAQGSCGAKAKTQPLGDGPETCCLQGSLQTVSQTHSQKPLLDTKREETRWAARWRVCKVGGESPGRKKVPCSLVGGSADDGGFPKSDGGTE